MIYVCSLIIACILLQYIEYCMKAPILVINFSQYLTRLNKLFNFEEGNSNLMWNI
jgi:hypothetical protein